MCACNDIYIHTFTMFIYACIYVYMFIYIYCVYTFIMFISYIDVSVSQSSGLPRFQWSVMHAWLLIV